MLQGKKILLAVSGSIAAYKTAFFIRLLVKEGAEVRVLMTKSAKDFITPLTLATLSKHKVYSDFFDPATGLWDSHVALGLWADAMVIAPASANTLAKMAQGAADNLVIATYLSARCPVFFAPAMDLDMHLHQATQKNLEVLQSYGNHLIAAEEGELASGLQGVGRMAEPETIVESLRSFWIDTSPLTGKRVLITSGPTYEKIDAVRFIGNHSSGRMGTALATQCAAQGAEVIFIAGPSDYLPSGASISIIRVESADEMYQAVREHFELSDIAIFAAAVSDYKPASRFDKKLKRNGHEMTIELVENKDIAAEMGRQKKKGQITVGFALETDDEVENAQKKLKNKNLDMVVLNSLNDDGAGFSEPTNKVSLFFKDNMREDFELKSKDAVASDIVNAITKKLNA
ncbi:MAG: bifunctional phosphopantothenoylcysteine decarboxylase/phosphopantothenate--cysteine ligase CoaBC [Bacteroidota bacterium]